MAIPLLKYAPTSQNSRVKAFRVGSDEDPKGVSLDKAFDRNAQNVVIESAYRQIFFHAFKVDRDTILESQLRDGQISVRDFIRALCLSDTFTRSFYNLNSNYRVARHLVEKLLGRQVYGKAEEIAWSAVIMTKGVAGAVDQILDSDEYLENFGYDTVPYHRNRVVGSREVGETPSTSPRRATRPTTEASWDSPRLFTPVPSSLCPQEHVSVAVASPRTTFPGCVRCLPCAPEPHHQATPAWITSPRSPIAVWAAEFSGLQAPNSLSNGGSPRRFFMAIQRRPSQLLLTEGGWMAEIGGIQPKLIPNEIRRNGDSGSLVLGSHDPASAPPDRQ